MRTLLLRRLVLVLPTLLGVATLVVISHQREIVSDAVLIGSAEVFGQRAPCSCGGDVAQEEIGAEDVRSLDCGLQIERHRPCRALISPLAGERLSLGGAALRDQRRCVRRTPAPGATVRVRPRAHPGA